MTPQQYRRKTIDLVRSFGPDSESELLYETRRSPEELCGMEFVWNSGLRLSLHFAYTLKFTNRKTGDWIHFGLHKLNEEVGRNIAGCHLDYCWWKWNIHTQSDIPVAQQRALLLQQLEHRLERCAEHGVIRRMALMK